MGFQNLAPASKSATAKLDSGETWSISYVDGSSASGNVCLDTVQVGATTVTSQGVEAAKSASSDFISDPSDGLLGLAFTSINTASPTQLKNFFSNAISTLAAPLLTANRKKGASGNYDFDNINASEYTSAITYVTGNAANGFWEFTGIDAIADTGTTLIYLPQPAVKAYYAKVAGITNSATYGGYVFPCSASLSRHSELGAIRPSFRGLTLTTHP